MAAPCIRSLARRAGMSCLTPFLQDARGSTFFRSLIAGVRDGWGPNVHRPTDAKRVGDCTDQGFINGCPSHETQVCRRSPWPCSSPCRRIRLRDSFGDLHIESRLVCEPR
ncbi:hypothetical protein LIA77_04230 [Sarocladium implicatum]|nr:hypothetical protein LIA77_04230 [Sarocladium implicatum]